MNENILKLSFCKPNKKINKLNRQKIISSLLKFLVSVSAVITIFFVLSIVGYILVKGIPQLRLSLFSKSYNPIIMATTYSRLKAGQPIRKEANYDKK